MIGILDICMRSEPYSNKDGYKIWLNNIEQEQLINYYSENLDGELAVRLGLHGLRADEIVRVEKQHLRELETNSDEERYVLTVPCGKTGFGEVPVSSELKKKIYTTVNARTMRQDEPVIDSSKRTVQRWVSNAGTALDEQYPEKDWNYLTCHDLRRTWATDLYYSLSGDRARELVMSFGRWTDAETFRNSYLGKPTDSVINEVMDEADIQ